MWNWFFKILLDFNSIMLFIAIYFVKSNTWIIDGNLTVSLIGYLLIPLILTVICLKIFGKLQNHAVEGKIVSVEVANNSFLPSYLAYFFVALSIPNGDWIAFAFVFGIIFLFTFFSQAQYFNPLFMIFGYKFYHVNKEDGVTLFLISRRDINAVEDLQLGELRKINNYTFVDKGK